ncbi:MAG: AAA family ATPase [Saprospiraceae bacterium]|nr:AAA family ATPase [Saprospiraceae bacterium]
MLNELHLENFRLFKSLDLNGLKQVNLFAGKNNSGKLALLEALRIWAVRGDSTVINHIIATRGQFTPGWPESYESLFYRPALASQGYEQPLEAKIGKISISRKLIREQRSHFALLVHGQPVPNTLDLNATIDHPNDAAIYIPFGGEAFFPLDQLWDKIALTEKEDDVVHILRETILPDLIRLDVKESRTIVRLASEKAPIPLKNLGDGAQRMLLMAIALVSAKDKMLLIDEIEAGLHHTVQEGLWLKIFEYAKKWNIQVFVTTHSENTVKAFTYAMEQADNGGAGAFFRLQQNRKTEQIEVIAYDLSRLESALELELETR